MGIMLMIDWGGVAEQLAPWVLRGLENPFL